MIRFTPVKSFLVMAGYPGVTPPGVKHFQMPISVCYNARSTYYHTCVLFCVLNKYVENNGQRTEIEAFIHALHSATV